MSVPSELISQFVKLTNDKNDNNANETICYGTIKIVGDKRYVQLDGSDQLTPVTSVVDIQYDATSDTGDRVIVMIKNHSAIVTGNITSPSASKESVDSVTVEISRLDRLVANKVDTAVLEAVNADIEKLKADDVTISGTLTAVNADIETLKAKDVEIDGKLTASEAEIEVIKTDKIDAEVAEAKFATIENLEATNADIHNLEVDYGAFKKATVDDLEATNADIKTLKAKDMEIDGKLEANEAEINTLKTNSLTADSAVIKDLSADIADIDTLIFGVASGDVIQTSFANAVIAQLGNAQIKSAMIETVSADKITAGDIITNNVQVKSEDGKLLISDETIQISDDTRVRVQIGKDASGDYSINIWDPNGNLMFSEGGITDSAIKNAIIRDDMVSETANISATKLNIDSLFTEINGSEKTINSSKIYLDDKNQTLDVAFTSLTTDLDNTKKAVSSQGTAISAVQGQIESKVWKQDINDATGNMSTKYTELEQDIDGFKTTVSETYTTKKEFNDLEVGGRNLVPVGMFDLNKQIVSTKEFELRDAWATVFISSDNLPLILEPGTEYTIKYDLELIERTDVPTPFDMRSGFLIYREGVWIDIGTYGIDENAEIGAITTVEKTFTTPTEWNGEQLIGYSRRWTTDGSSPVGFDAFKVTNFKIEKGNTATDWTPAPEDISDEIGTIDDTVNGIAERLSNAESTIEQLVGAIKMLVTDENGTTLYEQTSEGFTFNLSGVEQRSKDNQAGITDINTNLDAVSENIDGVDSRVNDTNDKLTGVEQSVGTLGESVDSLTDKINSIPDSFPNYIHMGNETINGESRPYLEFGEKGNNEKVRVSNFGIKCMDDTTAVGSMTITEDGTSHLDVNDISTDVITVNGSVAHISKQEDTVKGRFIWKTRDNGNFGLQWEGA